jgi:GT2 family glycosyltransferase
VDTQNHESGPDAVARVVAVVLTFRRTDPLRRCLDGLHAQTRPVDHIIVVDNEQRASTVIAPGESVELFVTGENLGPAGGYAVGFELALARGAQKIWPIDDDCEPTPECLERLLQHTRGADVVQPVQIIPGRERRSFHPAFKGPLVDAEVVRRVGVPDREIFFSTEDTEFFDRIRRGGFPIRRADDAVVLHHDQHFRARGQRRTWRLYYEVRNHLHYRIRVRRTPRDVLKALRITFGKLVMILVFESGKAASLRLWLFGWRDFLMGRRGKVIAPEDWQDPEPARRS